jgi:hypothetical protein
MFYVSPDVLLAQAILVDNNIVSPYIWNEVPVRVLDKQLDCYYAGCLVEMNFGLLLALPALGEWLVRSVWYLDLSMAGTLGLALVGPGILMVTLARPDRSCRNRLPQGSCR